MLLSFVGVERAVQHGVNKGAARLQPVWVPAMAEASRLDSPTIDCRATATIWRSTNPFNGPNMSCMSVACQTKTATLAEGNGRRRPKTCSMLKVIFTTTWNERLQ